MAALPLLNAQGLCPDCVKEVSRQERLYRQGKIYPGRGNNQHNTARFPYMGVQWAPSDWAVINTLKRASMNRFKDERKLSQRALALAVYGPTVKDMRHATRQRVYNIRRVLDSASAPYTIVSEGDGYQWVARDLH